jgi:uncharacterized protein YabE (DUF348 family)
LKVRKILSIVLATAVLLAAGFAFALRKTITLTVDGQTRTLSTYALTVGGLLYQQNISLAEQDALNPPLNSWLKDQQTVTLVRAIPVQIWADNQLVSFTSAHRSPQQLLAQAALTIHPADQLLSQGHPYPVDQPFPDDIPAISLQIKRAVAYTLVDAGQTLTLSSSAPTLGQALNAAGITYTAADRLDPPASTLLQSGLQAVLKRAHPLTIHTLAGDLSTSTTAITVGEALADAGMALQGSDYSLPEAAEPIPDDGQIRLVRVREEVLIEQTPLPFETQYQPAANVELDTQTIIQTGEYGLTARRIRVRYEDETEVSRQLESEWIARQPLPRIVGYGTHIVMRTITVDGISIDYWRALTMWATSYYPAVTSNTTASGLPLQKGVAAVDIRYIPFYTRMYVPGYGEAIAADIGGGVIGRWIDLGYSNEDYVSWHSYVTVYFLWPPPENVVWIIP